VPADVKILLEKYPTIIRTGDVMPNPSHGVEHYIHTGGLLPVFAKACCLDPKNMKLQKRNSRVWNLLVFVVQKSPWASPLHMVPKKRRVLAALR
jgi:hypothetical protein